MREKWHRAALEVVNDKWTPLSHADEFQNLVGEPIPYHRLGFSNPRALLRTIDGLETTCNRSGQCMLRINDSKISHIDKLICKQKKDYSKTKVCSERFAFRNSEISNDDREGCVDELSAIAPEYIFLFFQNKYYKQFTRQKSSFESGDERKSKIRKVYNNNSRVNKRVLNLNYHYESNLFENGKVYLWFSYVFVLNKFHFACLYVNSKVANARFISGDRNVSFEEDEENHHPVVIETNELKKIVSL